MTAPRTSVTRRVALRVPERLLPAERPAPRHLPRHSVTARAPVPLRSAAVVGCPDDGNSCTAPQTCNLATERCEPIPPAGEPAGTACDAGAGPSSGACDGVDACIDICTFNPACPDPGVECQVATCDPADGTCGSAPGPDGITCDFTGPGSADGSCSAGTCTFTPEAATRPTGSDTTPQSQVVSVGCTNNVTTGAVAVPLHPRSDVPTPIFGGGAFSADLDGIGFFPEFFLDAAQGVVCGGLRQAQLVDFVSTVQVRSGATGADVPLGIDIATLVPGPVSFCNFPTDQICTVGSDCLGGICEAPILIQDLPVLDGTPLSPGGCDADTSNCPVPGPVRRIAIARPVTPLVEPRSRSARTTASARTAASCCNCRPIRVPTSLRPPVRSSGAGPTRACLVCPSVRWAPTVA